MGHLSVAWEAIVPSRISSLLLEDISVTAYLLPRIATTATDWGLSTTRFIGAANELGRLPREVAREAV